MYLYCLLIKVFFKKCIIATKADRNRLWNFHLIDEESKRQIMVPCTKKQN